MVLIERGMCVEFWSVGGNVTYLGKSLPFLKDFRIDRAILFSTKLNVLYNYRGTSDNKLTLDWHTIFSYYSTTL